MKTIFSKMLVVAATVLGGLFVTKAHAQANPYPITNNLNCAVKVTFDVYKGNYPSPCNICSSTPGITIGPSSTVMLPLGPCMPVCDIYVTVTSISGVPLSPPVWDKLSDPDSRSGTGAGCAPTVRVQVLAGGATIN